MKKRTWELHLSNNSFALYYFFDILVEHNKYQDILVSLYAWTSLHVLYLFSAQNLGNSLDRWTVKEVTYWQEEKTSIQCKPNVTEEHKLK